MSVMKKFEAFQRNKQSLRELVIADANKPAVDDAYIRQWQSMINLLAMESDETIALLLQVRRGEISILLSSDTENESRMEGELAHGLYCESCLGNRGVLIVNRAPGGSPGDNTAAMAAVQTCIGLPIQWPDKTLFGVVCILHYPEKTLKPADRKILSGLREALEEGLLALYERAMMPQDVVPDAPMIADDLTTEPAFDVPVRETCKTEKPAETPAPAEPIEPEAEALPDVSVPVPEVEPAQAVVQPPVAAQPVETDALTAIYTRKKIEEILKHEFERAKRYFRTFSVTMINLGDTSGDDAGDSVLKTFAKSVGDKIRETDSWGRWSGDTFILVCPYADTVETQQMLTRIKPLVSREMKKETTFADFYFGVSQYGPDDLAYQAIVERAQENMLQYTEMVKRRPSVSAEDQNAGMR